MGEESSGPSSTKQNEPSLRLPRRGPSPKPSASMGMGGDAGNVPTIAPIVDLSPNDGLASNTPGPSLSSRIGRPVRPRWAVKTIRIRCPGPETPGPPLRIARIRPAPTNRPSRGSEGRQLPNRPNSFGAAQDGRGIAGRRRLSARPNLRGGESAAGRFSAALTCHGRPEEMRRPGRVG